MMHLHEVAAHWRLDEQMKEPVRFLTRQITSGRIRARKIGRHWMMTDDDMAFALDVFANRVAPVRDQGADHQVQLTPAGVPSIASMRRRRRA